MLIQYIRQNKLWVFVMKPYTNRSSSHERQDYLVAVKVAAILILSGIMVYILYKDKISAFMQTYIYQRTSGQTPSTLTREGSGTLSLRLDGETYTLEPVSELSTGAEVSEPSLLKLSMNQHSNLKLIFEKIPEIVEITLYRNDKVAFETQSTEIHGEDLPGDGEYLGVCKAGWNMGREEQVFYSFGLKVDFPPKLLLSASEINPGELMVLCANNLNPEERLDIETDLDVKPGTFQLGSQRVALFPVSYYNEPGKIYQVKVAMGNELLSYAIRVKEKEFITQNLTIDTKVAAATRNEKSTKEIDEKIDPLKPVADPEPYWDGKFLLPVQGGRVNEADFGKRRFVNKSPTSYRHNGLDIGQDTGVPVMASHNGRVLIADLLIETGNTIVIEHGLGLKTWYYHMNELLVKTGDWVSQGDVIGKVGSTGFSTSPHLHFSASVNGVFINPITLMNEEIPFVKPD